MKKMFLFGAIAALLSLAACDDKIETPDTPTGLKSDEVTTTAAKLSWTAVSGAQSYLVRINAATAVSTSTASYDATGLPSETLCTWSVQAVSGGAKSEWSANATFTTASDLVPVPADLKADQITKKSATLSWGAVEGATGYEVKVGDAYAVVIPSGTTYAVAGLDWGTKYPWTVTALKDHRRSVAAQSEFTTSEPVESIVSVFGEYYGDYYGNGTSNWLLDLAEFDGLTDDDTEMNGFLLELDMLAAPIADPGNVPLLDLPTGTFKVNGSGAANTIVPSYSGGIDIVDGEIETVYDIESGTVTIEKSGDNYTIVADIVFVNGTEYFVKWVGPVYIFNSFYVEPTEPIDMGTNSSVGALQYYEDGYGDGTEDLWYLTAWTDGITENPDTGYLQGSGYAVQTEMFTTVNGGPTLPDGEYNIENSYAPGTALKGFEFWGQRYGTYVYQIEDGSIVDARPGLSGKFTTSSADGVYTIVLDLIDHAGSTMKGTLKAELIGDESGEEAYAAKGAKKGLASRVTTKAAKSRKAERIPFARWTR